MKKVKDSTTSEISNLFQELIVSKIIDEIELLKKELDNIKESNESCEDKVEKLPKSSSISRIVEKEQTKVIDLINKIAKDSKSEEYLRAIVEYLKKQYSFSDKRTLCLVLDEIQQKNNMVFNEITPIKSFVETNNIEANLNSLINYIKDNTKDNPDGIWDTNIFGKTIEQIVNDGIYEKTHNITKDNMDKIGETIEKVMNENSGLVCLIV